MMEEIILENVSKYYGKKKAVQNISLNIKRGEPYLICGGNGAGKSTILKMLLGLLEPSEGKIIKDNRLRVGYLPEERGVYQDLTVAKNLEFFGQISNLPNRKQNVDKWIEKLQLADYKNVKAKYLSKGNGQKLQLAIAMINGPEFVILDEPFSGLDPVNMQMLEDLITEMKENRFIIISSHQLGRIEHICTDVLFLRKSECVLQGCIKEIKKSFAFRNLTIDYCGPAERYLKEKGYEYRVKNNRIYLQVSLEEQIHSPVIGDIINACPDISFINYEAPSLEQLFIEKIG